MAQGEVTRHLRESSPSAIKLVLQMKRSVSILLMRTVMLEKDPFSFTIRALRTSMRRMAARMRKMAVTLLH